MSSTKSGEDRLVTAARKAERDRDAAQATKEYHAEKARVDANTERLRALRLAKEAGATAETASPAKASPKSTSSKSKRARKSS